MSRAVAGVVRRGAVYYFRMALPRSLASVLHAREIKFSLRTENGKLARRWGRALRNGVETILEGVSTMSVPSFENVNAQVQGYFQQLLNTSLETSYFLPTDPVVDIQSEIDGLEERQARLRSEVASQAFEQARWIAAEKLMKAAGRPTWDADALRYACNGLARAEIEDARILIARLRGEFEKTDPADPLFRGMQANGHPPLPFDRAAGVAAQDLLTLDSAIERFIEFKSPAWAQKTRADVQRVMSLARDLLGPQVAVRSLSTEHVRIMRDALTKLPPNYMKAKASSGLSPQEAMQLQDRGTLSSKTQDKYMTMFRQFLIWLTDDGYIEKTPGAGVKLQRPKGGRAKERLPYAPWQLEMIFSSPLYRGHKSAACRHKPGCLLIKDAKYWVPYIALYSGMRLGEILQLTVQDVRTVDGIWCFDVNKGEEDEKALKTESSERLVPIHSALIDAGILGFFDGKKKTDRLFPEAKRGASGYHSHDYSKWYGRFSRKIGVHTKKTAFHSFRHNFTDALALADVNEFVSKALLGHVDKSTHSHYRSQLTPSQLRNAVEKICRQIDLSQSA